MQPATMCDIRIVAKRLGIVVEDDKECQCYRATCQPGSRFEKELHELVSVYGGGFIGNGATKADARADLHYQLSGYGALEPCDNPRCDWCQLVNGEKP